MATPSQWKSARAVLKCVQRAAASLPLSAAARTSVLSPSSSLPLSVLSRPSGSLTWERQWRGTWNGVHRQQLLSTRTQPQLSLQVQRWEGRGAVLHSAGAGRESIGIGSYETSPSGGEFPSLPAAPLGGVRRFNGGSTAASRLKAPPPLTAAPDEYTPSIPSRLFIAFALSHMFPHMLAHIHLHIIFPCMLLRVGALKQGQESEVHPLTHLLLSPFSLPSQQHPTWTTVESPPSVHPPLPSTTPSPAA
ncbi:unnamed protein product [Closterium sp. NIES-64]|nr:unnamed protein product [Closterium sp. NIES-64]